MLKGGAQKVLRYFLTRELEVLATVMGEGGGEFPPFKRGGGLQKVLLCLEGGGRRKKFRTRDFPIL